jgi:hypothetical protein
MRKFATFTPCLILFLLLCNGHILLAQPGPSFSASYDLFPYSNFADPKDDDQATRDFLEDVQIRIATLKLKASYPVALSEKTFLMHEILFDRFNMDYKNWNETLGGQKIDHAYAVKYNFMLRTGLSETWFLLAFVTPGLASDFKAKLSTDDLSFETALVFVKQYSKQFSLGFGAAYSRQFGEPFPFPVLALDWNNGSDLKLSAIIPASLELWYMMSPSIELGLVLTGDGNMYHGDESIYGGSKPRMRYSVITAGPSLKVRLSTLLSLNVDGGFALLRRFEFTNEDVIVNDINIGDAKSDYDLKSAGFIRAGIQIGG